MIKPFRGLDSKTNLQPKQQGVHWTDKFYCSWGCGASFGPSPQWGGKKRINACTICPKRALMSYEQYAEPNVKEKKSKQPPGLIAKEWERQGRTLPE